MLVAASCCVDVFQRQGLGDKGNMNGAKYRENLENLLQSAQDLRLG